MKSFRALFVVAGLSVALWALGVAPALASSSHVFSTAFGEAGSGDGQMELTEGGGVGGSGIAVNSSTHDLYVADTRNNRVDEFSSAGVFVRAWGWGVADRSTEALQVCTSGCHAGLSGAGAGQLDEPQSIAVDNSGGPSQGDVYVADSRGPVLKFSATGGYLSTNTGITATAPVAGPFSGNLGVAVDVSGNLWVYDLSAGAERGLFEFAQDGAFVTDADIGHGGITPIGMAVDSTDHLDTAGFFGIDRYTSSGLLLGPIISIYAGPTGVALDSSSDELFIDEERGERISRFAPSCDPTKGLCTPVETFGAAGELSGATQLAVDAGTSTVYAVNGDRRIVVFGRTPDVVTGAPATRTATTATLSGTVNPDNTPVSDCHFDYVADSEYLAGEPNPYATGGTVPCDVTPSGSDQVAVHANVAGLTPGVAYHFRLEASNVYGTSFGGDETVPGTPPSVGSTSAAGVTSATAELRAAINPEGGETTYHFEYGTTTAYGTHVPLADADIGSGVGDRQVARRIQGLLADTVYHYRVVAHNPLGTTIGPDRVFTAQPSGGTGVDTCSNAGVRALQQAAALPDCRAYEQVAPPNRDGAPILGPVDATGAWRASVDGGKIAYTSSGVFADAQTGGSVVFPYLSSRGQNGWSTHSLLPPQSPDSVLPLPGMVGYSSDLSKGILSNGGGGGLSNGQDQPVLVPGEQAHNPNLFLRDNSTDSYQLINPTSGAAGATRSPASFRRASSDLSHVVFEEEAKLTPDAPPAEGHLLLYDWSGGVVHLVSVFPNGTPMPTSLRALVTEAGFDNHAVSADGSRIYFETQKTSGRVENLYLRQSDTSTVQVDVSHGSGPGGHGEFALASSDGSLAFFRDDAEQGLTNDTVAGSGVNLYRYDANGGALVDLTPAAHAEVLGVLGASEDGAYVYYVANGVLAPGASSGDCSEASEHTLGNCNLYVSHSGVTTFIASLSGEDVNDWKNGNVIGIGSATAVVSPDGRYLAFQSLNSLTGYENVAANGVQCGGDRSLCTEVFLYAATSGKLSCASCNPNGGAPLGSSLLATPPKSRPNALHNYLPRYLSDRGRLFFNSLDALVSQDVNGQWDVYEFESEGVGSCGLTQGCVSLISSGTSPDISAFLDASLTGDDAFFTTSDRLVAQDGDQSLDLYDAKVGGGIASQNEVPGSGCGGEACKAPASGQPLEQAPGSGGLSGVGNLAPSTPVSGHGKPVKKKTKHVVKKKQKHKKKRRRARGRRANHNRGGAK
jgi:hypothetical protein